MRMIIDTETANTIEQPMPYDIGYLILDDFGAVCCEKSFCVAEMFIDHKDLLSSAYYAEKIPNYWVDIKNGKRVLKSLLNIRKEIWNDMRTFEVTSVGAYNMGFDKRACNNDLRYTTQSFLRWFFPYGTEFFCIWNFACNTILDEDFVRWSLEKNNISEKGNIITNAEMVYRYVSGIEDFVESHTGLEDVHIEKDIYLKCMEYNPNADKSLNSSCWRKVQKIKASL